MFQIELYGYNGNLPIYLDKFEEESFIVFSDLTPLSLRRNQLVPFEGDGHVSFLSAKFQFINQLYGRREINTKIDQSLDLICDIFAVIVFVRPRLELLYVTVICRAISQSQKYRVPIFNFQSENTFQMLQKGSNLSQQASLFDL